MKARSGLAAALVAAAIAITVLAPGADARQETVACKRTLIQGVLHFCGPAEAKLSKWPGFTFSRGTCVTGSGSFTLELGTIVAGLPKNGGKDYLKIQIFGPLTAPTSGAVIAWHHGTRWAGYGDSLTRQRLTGGWKFAASGTPPNRPASVSGTFNCGGFK